MTSFAFPRALLAAAALVVAMLAVGGCGSDGDDAVEEARQATVGGVEYTVTRARPLNPRAEPDDGYWQGPSPPAGKLLLGVYVTACNTTGEERATTDDMFLVDNPFETRFEPEPLDADNPFAYRPSRLDPDECFPAPASAAEQGPGASLVIFEIPDGLLQNRPLELVIDERGGEARLEGAKRIKLGL